MDYPASAVELKLANPLTAPRDPHGDLHFDASVDSNGKYSPVAWTWPASAWETPQSYPPYVIAPTKAVRVPNSGTGESIAIDPRTLSTDDDAATIRQRIIDDTGIDLSPVFDISNNWNGLTYRANNEVRKVLVCLPLSGGQPINLGEMEAQMNENGVGAPGKFIVDGSVKWAPTPLAAPTAKPTSDPARALLPTEEIIHDQFAGDQVVLKDTESTAAIVARITHDLATLAGRASQ